MAHTPGPWIAVESCEGCLFPSGVSVAVQMESEPYKSIGRICSMIGQGNDGKYSPKVTDANARLIAAAPELLEQLKRLVSLYKTDELTDSDFRESEEVIAKALGK